MLTLKNASGYVDCGCRDCLETTIGEAGDFCDDCQAAGCEPDSECQAENAYGGGDDKGEHEYSGSTKTAEGGHHDVDLQSLGEKMQHWHSSAGDPIYAVGSYFSAGKRHPQEGMEEKALAEFEKLLRTAETPAGAQHGGWNEDDIQELRDICDELQEVIASGPEASEDEHEATVASIRAANVSRLERHAAAARLIKIAKELMKVAGQSFLDAYIEAALWSSTDESTPQGGEPLDDNYGPEDLTPETKAKMAEDCKKFQSENADTLSASGLPDSQAGHDFWLTRNGHGSGFWDEEDDGDPAVKAALEALTSASKKFGETHLYVGDNGEIDCG